MPVLVEFTVVKIKTKKLSQKQADGKMKDVDVFDVHMKINPKLKHASTTDTAAMTVRVCGRRLPNELKLSGVSSKKDYVVGKKIFIEFVFFDAKR